MNHRSKTSKVLFAALAWAVLSVSPASAAVTEGKVILRDDTFWKVWSVRGPMRIDGDLLKNEEAAAAAGITASTQRAIRLSTQRLLEGQHVDWTKTDWRDVAAYCPDIIGNPYYPSMVSLVQQEYPPEGWSQADFDDHDWMTVWNTKVRGEEGKGSVYNRALYMRSQFEVPDPAQVKELVLTLTFRGGARVFLNGQEIARKHLPDGPLAAQTPGAAYPTEAYLNKREESADRKTVVAIGEIWTRFVKGGQSNDPRLRRYRCPAAPDWNGFQGPWLNRDGWNRLLTIRDRQIGPITIPASKLRAGRNSLAIEVRGSLYHPLIYADGIWGHGKEGQWNAGKSWDHARLVSLQLVDPAGKLPSVMEPAEGFGVWVEDMHQRVYDWEYRPAAMPTGKLKFVGAINGHFSGTILVRSGKKIDGFKAVPGDLKSDGGGAIPAAAVTVVGMVAEKLTEMGQLGVNVKGLGDGPINVMSVDATEHMMSSPLFQKPMHRDRGWMTESTPKIGFYDHIGSTLPSSVPANTLQPLWVQVTVPMGTPAGVYRGSITVGADPGAPGVAVPVECEVIGWRVPDPREFLSDMGMEQHPYAVANHYLLPKGAATPGTRDWEGPVKAKVPLWSDEHFRLMANSFKQMARAGNDLLFIPVLQRTEFGNWEDSMIKWIRRKDGSYDFDFTIMDRYLDLAVQHMGKPRVVCFVVMHCQMASPTPAVTVLDEATGKTEVLSLGWQQDAFARLPIWQQFGAGVLKHMRDKGMERSVYWGHGGDHESDPALMGLFFELFPNNYWAASGHTYHGGAGGGGHSRNVVRYFADVYGAACPAESKMGWKGAYIGGGPTMATGQQYAASGMDRPEERLVRNETYLYVHIPRDELNGAAMPIRWRGIPSVSLHRGYCGLGHIGFDGYDYAYLDGYIGSDWAFPGRPHHMMSWPGPDGAESSARYEALLEGLQEGEARIFLEQTVDRGLLSAGAGGKVRQVLLDYLNHYCIWPQLRSDRVYDYLHDWRGDSRELFSTAAEVARTIGVDMDQINLRARVAALGQRRRELLLRNWTGQPRAWTARTDAAWLKVAETGGELAGFKPLEYVIDGTALKPGQTVEGNVFVKDTQTGREQAFHVIADVIPPIELTCDHANFNVRPGKDETRQFRLVSNAAVDVDWQLSVKPPWIKVAPAAGTIHAGSDLFVTLTAAPPDQEAVTHDNGMVLSGAKGLVNQAVESRTFVVPLLREKEGRKMPFGKIIKIDEMGETWTSFATCMKGTKIETGAVRELGKSHTQALANPSEGPPAMRKEYLPIIGQERFSRSLWAYPHSEAVFKLEGSKIQAVSAYVGVSNDARQRLIRNQHRRVSFEIWVDGKVVTQSGLMKTTDSARYLTVENLNGAKELKLVTRLDSDKDDNTFLVSWCDVNFYAEHEKRELKTLSAKDGPNQAPAAENAEKTP